MDNNIDFGDVENGGGGDGRYSFSSTPNKSNNHDDEGEEGEENALSYFEAATEALKAADARPYPKQQSLELLDVPTEGSAGAEKEPISQHTRESFASDKEGARPTQQHDLLDAGEEAIVFDNGSSPQRRAAQEYYDVLEMASNRLKQEDGSAISGEVSSGDEAVRKKKKKKKKSKKKDKRKKQSKESSDSEEDIEVTRRSAVFTSLFPTSMMQSHSGKAPFQSSITNEDLAKVGLADDDAIADSTAKENGMMDPNDDLPNRWNPASLVAAAQSKMSQGRINKDGYYNNMKERADTALGKVQTLVNGRQQEDIPDDYNLHNIGKSEDGNKKKKKKKKKYSKLQRCDSIDWGDESMLSGMSQSVTDRGAANISNGEAMQGEGQGIEMVDDCSFETLDEAKKNYLLNEHHVQKLMWQRKRRKYGLMLLAGAVLFTLSLLLYIAKYGGSNDVSSAPQQSSTMHDEIDRNEAPSRPLPQIPSSITGLDSAGFHTMTLTDLVNIVNSMTQDASVINNPHSPQAKALEWCKNDMKIYNVEVASRMAQRYSLATLYYATNGTGWDTNTNWGNGHECEWYGVGCETGESNVVSVTYLDLSGNNLIGSIPPEIGFVASLEQIHLWDNSLNGTIPSTLSQLAKLHTLYLDNNHLSGEIGDTFDQMKSMMHIDLSGNRLRGHIPHGLGALTNLRDLRLSHNFLTSTFPNSLISLSNLQTLLLDSNAISGSLPPLVGEMRSLVTIRIQENDLKGKLPQFSDAVYLEEAHFDGNYFSGPIPHFGSSRLRELYLGQNSFSGSIPESIGDLPKLEIFSARENQLVSSIPSSISKATELQILDLSSNKLTGTIPEEFLALYGLHELRLDHNQLHGYPTWLGSAKRLEIIHLNNNLLDGKLGLNFDMGDLGDLLEFTIENNDLTGVIGECMCDLLLDVLTSDCWGSSPQVDCPCCTECF